MTTIITGYIVGLYNPNFSGLATVEIASRKNARKTRKPGTLTRVAVEAGFGVRQIVAYFGSWESLTQLGPITRLSFAVEDGLLAGIVEDE